MSLCLIEKLSVHLRWAWHRLKICQDGKVWWPGRSRDRFSPEFRLQVPRYLVREGIKSERWNERADSQGNAPLS
jgi:hypothetical protein